MRIFSLLICLLSATFIVSGCFPPEEPKYYVTVNGVEQPTMNVVYYVPAEGGKYIVAIRGGTKYPDQILVTGSVRDSCVWSNGPVAFGYEVPTFDLREQHLVGDWYDVFFKENEGLIVEIQPNKTSSWRHIEIDMSSLNFGRDQILKQVTK